MSAIPPSTPRPENLPPREDETVGARLRQFTAPRGVLLLKQMRDIGQLPGSNGRVLTLTSVILTAVHSEGEITIFGIQLGMLGSEEDGVELAPAFLDLDELPEFLKALEYIRAIAAQLRKETRARVLAAQTEEEARDYTEVRYLTRDSVELGFSQIRGEQQAYFQLGSRTSPLLFNVSGLDGLERRLRESMEYLNSHAKPDHSDSPDRGSQDNF